MDSRERRALRWMHVEVNRLQGDIKWLRTLYHVSEDKSVDRPRLWRACRHGWHRFGVRCHLLAEVLRQAAIDSTALETIQEKFDKLAAVAAAGEESVAVMDDDSTDQPGWAGPLCSAEDTLDGLEEYVRLLSGLT